MTTEDNERVKIFNDACNKVRQAVDSLVVVKDLNEHHFKVSAIGGVLTMELLKCIDAAKSNDEKAEAIAKCIFVIEVIQAKIAEHIAKSGFMVEVSKHTSPDPNCGCEMCKAQRKSDLEDMN